MKKGVACYSYQETTAGGDARCGGRITEAMGTDPQPLTIRHAPDGRLLAISATCWMLLRYQPDELLGHSLYGLVHPHDRSQVREAHQRALAGMLADPLRYRLRCRDGSFRWVEARHDPHDPGGLATLRVIHTIVHAVAPHPPSPQDDMLPERS